MSSPSALHVAAAVIEQGNRILIARRPKHLHQGGLWEFPGGKVEAGETVSDALIRELGEELGIAATQYHPLIRIPHDYGDRQVLLDVWKVTDLIGQAQGREGQEVRWVTKEELSEYDFPAANAPIVTAARLPAEYLITPEPDEVDAFLACLNTALASGIRLVQFRAKHLQADAYRQLAHQVVERCHRAGAQLLLNADPALLQQVDADGIHLNSNRLMSLVQRPIPADKCLAASCHDLEQIEQAQNIGVDFILVSPVNMTASHPGARALGWDGFRKLTEQARLPVYALGGMTPQQLTQAWEHGAQGIAAIRSLWGKL